MADVISSFSFDGVVIIDDDNFEDGCSICLEPFTGSNPSAVTSCKHEYHLHCILEWSQRSKECPICMQSLILKDPANQELLEAAELERVLKSAQIAPAAPRILHFPEDASYSDDSDLDEHFMHRLAAAASRVRFVHRRTRQRSQSPPVFSYTSTDSADMHQHHPTLGESQNFTYEFSEDDSSPSSMQFSDIQSSRTPSVGHVVFSNIVNRDNPSRDGVLQNPPDSPQQANRSDVSLSESIKSKFSAASSRCKESFAKSTRGFMEKILVRNNSVKELSKGVQRDMNAGFARMLERLDLKKTGSSVSDPGCTVGSSNTSSKGKGLHEDVAVHSCAPDAVHNCNGDQSSACRGISLLHICVKNFTKFFFFPCFSIVIILEFASTMIYLDIRMI